MTQFLNPLPAQRVGAAGASGKSSLGTTSASQPEAPDFSEGMVDILVDKDGKQLSRSEAAILRALMAAKGRTLSIDFLVDQIVAHDTVSSNAVLRVLIHHIRRKRPDLRIVSRHGYGYALEKTAD